MNVCVFDYWLVDREEAEKAKAVARNLQFEQEERGKAEYIGV